MYDLDAKPLSLLTVGNPKTAKGEGRGYYTAIMHFAPHKLSGRNVCSHASEGCIVACLNKSGHGGIALDSDGLNAVQVARIRRTRYFSRDLLGFMSDLAVEIVNHERAAIRHGLIPAVRLNGTSDLPWENIRCGGHKNIMAMFPGIQFYDYTKVPARIRRNASAIPNYHLTFSLSESNDDNAGDAVLAGLNVAVAMNVRKGAPLPATFELSGCVLDVIDGDETDLRFLDRTNVVVGLRAKGSRGKADTSGFVRSV